MGPSVRLVLRPMAEVVRARREQGGKGSRLEVVCHPEGRYVRLLGELPQMTRWVWGIPSSGWGPMGDER